MAKLACLEFSTVICFISVSNTIHLAKAYPNTLRNSSKLGHEKPLDHNLEANQSIEANISVGVPSCVELPAFEGGGLSRITNSTCKQDDMKVLPSNDIQRVIKMDAVGTDLKLGSKVSDKFGSTMNGIDGERLKGNHVSGFEASKSGGHEEDETGGKTGAKVGDKWLKDEGHNRHGWKNVYHREEYAQHQKFHDIFRDKDWFNQRGKTDSSYNVKNGTEYDDSKAREYLDTNRHGSKYDYQKGSDWRKSEDDDESSDDLRRDRETQAIDTNTETKDAIKKVHAIGKISPEKHEPEETIVVYDKLLPTESTFSGLKLPGDLGKILPKILDRSIRSDDGEWEIDEIIIIPAD